MKHILIDFENVQPEPEQLAGLDDDCHIWLFLGKLQQKTLSLELCEALCRFGKNVHFVRVAKTGKNALDFYLAYYLGRITEQDKDALVFILSRDGGYDVLVEHLEENGLCRGVVRSGDLALPSGASEIEEVRALREMPSENAGGADTEITVKAHNSSGFIQYCFKKALKELMQVDGFRPVARNDLESQLLHFILKEDLAVYDETQRQETVTLAVDRLVGKGFVSVEVSDGLLTYRLSDADLLEQLIAHLEKSKPKTAAAAKQILKTKADSIFLEAEDADLGKILQYCQSKKRLRINGNKIEYPPFAPIPEPVQMPVGQAVPKKPVAAVAVGKEVNAEMVDKAKKFFAKSAKNKPGSKKALANSFKSALKLDDKQIENLIGVLAAQKMFNVQDTGKIVYK